jgi:hypothetical protein
MFVLGDPLAKRAGKIGGKRRGQLLSATRLRKSAQKAARARWSDPAQVEAHRARMRAKAAALREQGLLAPLEARLIR